MQIEVVVAPAVEPVSLEEMRAWLRRDGTTEDLVIDALIKAARRRVEHAARRRLIDQTLDVRLSCPTNGRLILPVSPVRSVDMATAIGYDGVEGALAATDWRVQLLGGVACVILGPLIAAEAIQFRVRAGFGPAATDVPDDLRLAIKRLVALWFEHRGDETGEPWPADVEALVAPYRAPRL
jgi:uncharacterized phiE125 gp8 family phage protein